MQQQFLSQFLNAILERMQWASRHYGYRHLLKTPLPVNSLVKDRRNPLVNAPSLHDHKQERYLLNLHPTLVLQLTEKHSYQESYRLLIKKYFTSLKTYYNKLVTYICHDTSSAQSMDLAGLECPTPEIYRI